LKVDLQAIARLGSRALSCLLWSMLLPIVGHGRDAKPGSRDRQATLIFLSSEGKVIATAVKVAATFAARRRGLLDCDSLHPEEGLLLSPGGCIHTVGMQFAIDVLFLDQRMQVLKCVHQLRPWRAALAPLGTRHVLELVAGRAAATQVDKGTKLFWLECVTADTRE
jgi:uncharacterized membrane protein (UPF0127 family)